MGRDGGGEGIGGGGGGRGGGRVGGVTGGLFEDECVKDVAKRQRAFVRRNAHW